jgi:uncharacterized protein (DUF362 family)
MIPDDCLVAVARSSFAPGYAGGGEPAPELRAGRTSSAAESLLRRIFLLMGLDAARAGTPAWNPLGDLVPRGSRVVLKPNWVLHENQSGQGLECLITHPSIIEAAARYAALAEPSSLIVGDAPVQGCDLAALHKGCRFEETLQRLSADGIKLAVVDFRRTILEGGRLGNARAEGVREMSDYVLFDVANDSLLEQICDDADRLRVTMYNPDLLHRTHSPGRHQYLVAREIIEADLVINLPKLKTHMKAGVTGALKNLIGINGNKEYLPHHRKGGSGSGGDCYEGQSWLKWQAENLLDIANRQPSGPVQALLAKSGEVLVKTAAKLGSDNNLEGGWHGNDTIWRTCLDLQRILRYGRTDATIEQTPQRRVLSITDAIVGGEGQGPLANTPIHSGFVSAGLNPASVEYVNTRLMGIDPDRIALVREAFGRFIFPLTTFGPSEVMVLVDGSKVRGTEIMPFQRPFTLPRGWVGACELQECDAPQTA